MDKKSLNWEKSSQVEEMMVNNKPVRVKEYPKYLGWEKCVREYWDREARGKKK